MIAESKVATTRADRRLDGARHSARGLGAKKVFIVETLVRQRVNEEARGDSFFGHDEGSALKRSRR